MLEILNRFHGYNLTEDELKRIQLSLSLHLRNVKAEYQEKAWATANTIIWENLECGQSAQHGIVYTHTNTRLEAPIFIPRETIAQAIREIDSAGVEARTYVRRRVRDRYIVLGPNHVWSVDSHDKLKAYGIEIYSIIDAYSQMIIGLFVGISSRTAVAVQKYFLLVVDKYGVPWLVRSDKGSETVLMVACQIHMKSNKSFKLEIILTIYLVNAQIHEWWDCYLFRSIRLQYFTPQWWGEMNDGQSEQWLKFFENLKGENLFNSCWADVTAIRYIYLPEIRR